MVPYLGTLVGNGRVLPASAMGLAGESREALLPWCHSTSSPDCGAVLFGLARSCSQELAESSSSSSANDNNNHNNNNTNKVQAASIPPVQSTQ